MKKSVWTDADIRRAISNAKDRQATVWASDPGAERGKGTLELRASADGKGRWYWRYARQDRSAVRIALGSYGDREGDLSLREARLARDSKIALYTKPDSRDVRSFEIEQERVKHENKVLAAQVKLAQVAVEREQRTLSVRRLLDEYVAHLEKAGKSRSASDAKNLFKNHVHGAFPALSTLPAAKLSSEQVVAILRLLISAEKRTTARKLRSYMRAAFALAVGAALDPNSKAQMDHFGIKDNPVHSVKTINHGSVPGHRTLNESELRAYISCLEELKNINAIALLVALYTGGQRMSQLLRIRVADVDTKERTFVILDAKGRRSKPRRHVVPYGSLARLLLDPLLAKCKVKKMEFVFVTDVARVDSKVSETSRLVNKIYRSFEMSPRDYRLDVVKPFRMGDLRRTCETMLAPLVTKDIRAQLLSHGVSGIQATNYDLHEYLAEKRAAIAAWETRLTEIIGDSDQLDSLKPAARHRRESRSELESKRGAKKPNAK